VSITQCINQQAHTAAESDHDSHKNSCSKQAVGLPTDLMQLQCLDSTPRSSTFACKKTCPGSPHVCNTQPCVSRCTRYAVLQQLRRRSEQLPPGDLLWGMGCCGLPCQIDAWWCVCAGPAQPHQHCTNVRKATVCWLSQPLSNAQSTCPASN